MKALRALLFFALPVLLATACSSSSGGGAGDRCVDFEVGGLSCPCATTSDCSAGHICSDDGMCANPDPRCFPEGRAGCACSEVNDCSVGLDCLAGICGRPECASDSDCPVSQLCVEGNCFPLDCRVPADCQADHSCDAGRCRPTSCEAAELGSICYSGPAGSEKEGICRVGFWRCDAQGQLSCDGEVLPEEERCDGLDDDCDGEVDEGLTRGCGESEGICELGEQACVDGEYGECVGGVVAQEESCNGVDDDCDGTTDEDCDCEDGAERACGPDEGACEAGTQTCVDGAWGDCEGAISGGAESCNNIDDDCDGDTDEELTRACGESTGACEPGVETCAAGDWGACEGGVAVGAELCDGNDADCDGEVDCDDADCAGHASCQAPCTTLLRCEAEDHPGECGVATPAGRRHPDLGQPWCATEQQTSCACDLVTCTSEQPLCAGTYDARVRAKMLTGCNGNHGELGGTCTSFRHNAALPGSEETLFSGQYLNVYLDDTGWDWIELDASFTLEADSTLVQWIRHATWFSDVSGVGNTAKSEIDWIELRRTGD